MSAVTSGAVIVNIPVSESKLTHEGRAFGKEAERLYLIAKVPVLEQVKLGVMLLLLILLIEIV